MMRVLPFISAGYVIALDTGTLAIPDGGNATVSIYENGVVTGSYSFTVEVSHDGTNFAVHTTTITAPRFVQINGPVGAVKVTCASWTDPVGEIQATLAWQTS